MDEIYFCHQQFILFGIPLLMHVVKVTDDHMDKIFKPIGLLQQCSLNMAAENQELMYSGYFPKIKHSWLLCSTAVKHRTYSRHNWEKLCFLLTLSTISCVNTCHVVTSNPSRVCQCICWFYQEDEQVSSLIPSCVRNSFTEMSSDKQELSLKLEVRQKCQQ